jgi:NADH-quinone oxidoreductase subunit M
MTPLWTLLCPLVGALAVLALPTRAAIFARVIALAASIGVTLAAALGCLNRLTDSGSPIWSIDHAWIPQLGSRIHLAADGLALPLLLLNGIVAIAGVLFSWNIANRPRAFFSLFLLIIGGVSGVFLSRDAFLLFVFYEVVILPKYLLIVIWGSADREYGAMKLTMYSIGASALILVGLAAAYAASGGVGFDIERLASAGFSVGFQIWAFPVLFLGFVILAGVWPFHTWAPTGHVAAPTAASMLLAGVVMKLGAYGALCVAMPLFPKGFEFWRPVIAALAVVGILHGALTALTRKDLKFVIGYSSVSHMGFILLGMAAATHWGLRGAMLQMISHGIIAGLLFGIAGRVIYDRTHTRDLDELKRFPLWQSLPAAAVALTLATAASMGLPGFSGFVAEISVLIGLWQTYPWLVPVAAAGIVVTGAFSLRALCRTCFPTSATESAHATKLPPLTWPEITAIALLLAASLAIGLHPTPWITLIDDGLNAPVFQPILHRP